MAEQLLTQETVPTDRPAIALDDTFLFACQRGLDCFTSCCGDVAIVLTPYDVLRMKKALEIDSTDFLEKYTTPSLTREQKIPVVLLKMDPETRRCQFVTPSGCGIYGARPWACRMYPLGVAEPRHPTPEARPFYFLLREDSCHGHGQGPGCSVREWLADQGIEQYEMMEGSFKRLMLSELWDRAADLPPEKLEMYFMACYDLDRFRRFVFETRLLKTFDVDEARVEAIRSDDEELLDFAMDWLQFVLLGEKTMRIRQEVLEEARRRAAQGGDAAPQTDKLP
jgi:Fe-S-cluster containining protein